MSLRAIAREHEQCHLALTTFLDLSCPDIGLSMSMFKHLDEVEVQVNHQAKIKESNIEIVNFRRENDVLKLDDIAIALSRFRQSIESQAE